MPRHVLLTVLVAVAATGCCSGGTAVLHPGLDVGGTRRALVGFCVNGASGGPGGLVGRRGVAAGLAVCQWSGRFALGERQQGAGGRGRIRAGAAWRAASKDEKSERGREAALQAERAKQLPKIFDVRFDGSQQREVVWDTKWSKFVRASIPDTELGGGESAGLIVQNEYTPTTQRVGSRLKRGVGGIADKLRAAFLPWGVTKDYYEFTRWRIAQRIVSSTVSVFGTQSLLLALGVKTNKAGAAAAAGWIWANAFGKFGKMAFAAKWGRKFDSDAKRWRFRSALMWVGANGLEITTFVAQGQFPVGFIFIVAISVTLKQISILTSSATRGTFYKQFAGNNENLGDITAKGDAQVAVADLIGMVIGIELARLAGSNALAVWSCYVVLSSIDFWLILKSLDMIVFRFLNLERSFMIAHHFAQGPDHSVPSPEDVAKSEPVVNRPSRAVDQNRLTDFTKGYWAGTFRGVSETPLTPTTLASLLGVFADDQYLIVPRHKKRAVLILRQSATDIHVLQAVLALERFESIVPRLKPRPGFGRVGPPREMDNEEMLALVREVRDWARSNMPDFIQKAQAAKWACREDEPVLNFGYIAQRAIW